MLGGQINRHLCEILRDLSILTFNQNPSYYQNPFPLNKRIYDC